MEGIKDYKKVRKAVIVYLIKDNKVITIKYFTDNQNGWYDIPGGKIEDGESNIDAAIREFKEETKIDIKNPEYSSNLVLEYPERIFDFDVFIVNEYNGNPETTLENTSSWIDINELINKEKKFGAIKLLEENYIDELLNKTHFKYNFNLDNNHNIIGRK